MAPDIRHRRYTGMKQPWPYAARSLLRSGGRGRGKEKYACRCAKLESVMETTITIIERGKTVDMRVRFMNWHGKDYCDIRTFVTSGATTDRVPSRKGIAVPVGLLPELIAALQKAQEEARAAGLLKVEVEAA